MNTIPETAGAFDTPIANIQRQFPRNATTRHQVRTALYQPAHEDGPDPDGHDDKDPDVDQDGFVPINGHEQDGNLDDNQSIRSARSTNSSSSHDGWLNNPNLPNGKILCRVAFCDARFSRGIWAHARCYVMQSLKAGLFNGIPVVKNLTSYWRAKNGKTECSNIAAVVAELEKERQLIFSAVLEVANFTGHHAREKLNTAFDMLFGDSLTIARPIASSSMP